MKSKIFLLFISAFILSAIIFSCNTDKKENGAALQQRVQTYLDSYNSEFQKVLYADNLAQWELQTHIVEGDTMAKHRAAIADEEYAEFTGSEANIDSAKK